MQYGKAGWESRISVRGVKGEVFLHFPVGGEELREGETGPKETQWWPQIGPKSSKTPPGNQGWAGKPNSPRKQPHGAGGPFGAAVAGAPAGDQIPGMLNFCCTGGIGGGEASLSLSAATVVGAVLAPVGRLPLRTVGREQEKSPAVSRAGDRVYVEGGPYPLGRWGPMPGSPLMGGRVL